MFATTTVRFALVAAVVSSLTSAAPIFNLGRKEAVAMVRRAENDGQLAQGTNYFFSTLHLEDACAPGQVACVSGNYATCSGEGNWEISPCTSGSTCLATPASSPSGISIQCTSQESAQSSIQNAGGNPNTIAADFHVTDAPFSAATVPDPSASSSSAAPSSTETASPTDTPTESASATESSSSSTCTPDDEEGDDGTIADGPTDTASTPAPTETPEPSSTCTDEPIETEVITVIVVPVPSQSGVYSTTTLFPEATATVVGTEAPVPSPTESSSEAASESAPAESSSESSSEGPAPTDSSSESAPTDSSSSSEGPAPTESSSSSESAATVTTIILEPGYSIPALPTGAGAASTPIAIPVVSVVGTHNLPAKRMARVVRR